MRGHRPEICYPGSGWTILASGHGDQMPGGAGPLLIQKNKFRIILLKYSQCLWTCEMV